MTTIKPGMWTKRATFQENDHSSQREIEELRAQYQEQFDRIEGKTPGLDELLSMTVEPPREWLIEPPWFALRQHDFLCAKTGPFDVDQRALNCIGHGGGLTVEVQEDLPILRNQGRVIATRFKQSIL